MNSKSSKLIDSETFLLFAFEKLFLFEFYCRYLQLNQREEFEHLLQLKEAIQKKFTDLNIFDRLCEEELNSDIDDLVRFVLDFLQYGDDSIILRNGYNLSGISDSLFKDILDVANEVKQSGILYPESRYYRHADLVYANDIEDILHWLGCLKNKEFRAECKLEGKFGTKGLEYLEDGNKFYDYYNFPFKYPKAFKAGNDNYQIFYSNSDTVNINDEIQSNSLILSVTINKTAGNIDNILDEFRSLFGTLQSQFNWDQLRSGMISDFQLLKPKYSMTDLIKKKYDSKHNQVITQFESITKNLVGLYCYDLYIKSNNTIENSATSVRQSLVKYKNLIAVEEESIKRYYGYVIKSINSISELLEKSLEAASTPLEKSLREELYGHTQSKS